MLQCKPMLYITGYNKHFDFLFDYQEASLSIDKQNDILNCKTFQCITERIIFHSSFTGMKHV